MCRTDRLRQNRAFPRCHPASARCTMDSMGLEKVLKELREERQAVVEALTALEELIASKQVMRGRPPKWLVEARKRKQTAESEADKKGPRSKRYGGTLMKR